MGGRDRMIGSYGLTRPSPRRSFALWFVCTERGGGKPLCAHVAAVTWFEARAKAWSLFGREPNAVMLDAGP